MRNIYKYLLNVLLFIISISIHSQKTIGGRGSPTMFITINGDTNVSLNDTETYTIQSLGSQPTSGTWSIVGGGSIVRQTATTVIIKWTSAGTKQIAYQGKTRQQNLQGVLNLKVTGLLPTPNTPATPIIQSTSCGQTTIQRRTPPNGINWYWQGTNSNGTSTANLSSTYTITQYGRYYLRARNNQGIWSLVSSYIDITVNKGSIWYADIDGDGLGDSNTSQQACKQPAGYVSNNNDQCVNENGNGSPNGCLINNNQYSNENYILTKAYQKPTQTITNEDIIENITYFDGLGRPKQSIAIGQSPLQQDIVNHISYDVIGRQAKEFLPYVTPTQNGKVITGNVATATQAYYKTHYTEDFIGLNLNEVNSYLEKKFEASPLNRVVKQAAPGKDWKLGNGHEIKFEYNTNITNDVRLFYVTTNFSNNTYIPSLQENGFYNAGELHKTITKDENWISGLDHTTEEFKNKQGQVVLKRTYNKQRKHDTYYVYDDFGNLSYVLPPKINTYSNAELFADQHFSYSLESNSDSNTVDNIFEFHNDQELEELSIDISISPSWNKLYFSFEAYFEGSYGEALQPLIEIPLNFTPALPDMYIGKIEGSDYYNEWSESANVSIRNNKLIIESNMLQRQSTASEFEGFASIDLNAVFGDKSIYLPINEADLNELAYQYVYDHKNRLVEKKIPGKDWEYIVYDKLDRPVLTQDTNLKADRKWLFTKYDALGRVAYTGMHTTTINRNNRIAMQAYFSSQNNTTVKQYEAKITSGTRENNTYYRNTNFPNSKLEIYSINYYDNYEFDTQGLPNSVSLYKANGKTSTNRLKGLATGTKIKVLGTADWITTITYYDDKARPIHIYSKNEFLNTVDIVESKLDAFTGRVEETKTTHKKTGQSDIVTIDTFEYDHVNRLLQQTQQINNQAAEVIVENSYDELGQLKTKAVGGKVSHSRLQTIDYSYNVRGWLQKINDPSIGLEDDLFSMELKYNNANASRKLYNGNISQTEWKTANDNKKRRYSYYYDALNRITNARYYLWRQVGRYNLSGITYDKNGNILTLRRSGTINDQATQFRYHMDNLVYSYDKGNKLHSVTDNGYDNWGFKDGNSSDTVFKNGDDDFSYDANGNMLTDANKGITNIKYNHLNLPIKVVFDNNPNKEINYIYDTSGVKLRKMVKNGATTTITDYAGNYIYKNNELQFFNQPEGYVKVDNVTSSTSSRSAQAQVKMSYVYQHKDHLGNIRLSYSDSNNDGVISESLKTTVWEDGFEDGKKWNGKGGRTITGFDSNFKRNGNKSGYIYIKSNKYIDYYCHSTDVIPINNQKDTYYKFSGWMYLDPSIYRGQFFFFMKKEGETFYYTKIDYIENKIKGKWVYLEKTILVPSNIKTLNFRIDADGLAGVDGKVWFDDLKIEKIGNGSSEIIEESNYYPFGLKHKGYNNVTNGIVNNYQTYLGQEWSQELGIDWHSYKWRNANPAIGRFFGIDPITENYPNQTPYQFASNNPVWKIEIEGLEGYVPTGSDIINGSGFSVGHMVFNPQIQYHNPKKPITINNGVISGGKVINNITSATVRPAMESIDGIVLHRTVSSTAESAIRTTINNGGRTGFHIVIDTDGTITQVNNLENRANHVGKPTGKLNNNNSIGVEVVGQHTGYPGENSWDPLTTEQIDQTTSAIFAIMREYNIDADMVVPHENASRKTAGEGGVVKNSITIYPLSKLPSPVAPSLPGRPSTELQTFNASYNHYKKTSRNFDINPFINY